MSRFYLILLTLGLLAGSALAQTLPGNPIQVYPATLGYPLVSRSAIPTIASDACGTGANGAVTAGSRVNAGQIVIGAQATTACTIVFATVLPAADFCVISPANAAAAAITVLAYVSASTTAGFVITGSVLASTTWNYNCL